MKLYVEEYGPAGAETIVFLHGGGLSGRMWQPQVERLAEYHCIVPDLPEQGHSAHVAPFSLDDATERVADVIAERATGGRAHIVGLSLGGAVALTVLRRTPQHVAGVVVSGTTSGFGRTLGAISKGSAGLYRWFREDALVDLSIRQFGIPEEHRDMFREDLIHGMRPDFIRNYTDALMGMSLPTRTKAPLLAAVGGRETWAAKRGARKLVAAVSGARGVLVPGVGHVWNLERPKLFADMVRASVEQASLPEGLLPFGQPHRGEF